MTEVEFDEPFGWQSLRDALERTLDTHLVRSDIPVDGEMKIPGGYTVLMVGPVTGEGEITGNGTLRVIDSE